MRDKGNHLQDGRKAQKNKGENCLHKNDIARIKIKTTTPFFFDAYRNRNTGSFILIDENNLNTVGAGMINN